MTMMIEQFGALNHGISRIIPRNANGMLPLAESQLQYCGIEKRNWEDETNKASEDMGLNINRG